jgi:hypothetical protein
MPKIFEIATMVNISLIIKTENYTHVRHMKFIISSSYNNHHIIQIQNYESKHPILRRLRVPPFYPSAISFTIGTSSHPYLRFSNKMQTSSSNNGVFF